MLASLTGPALSYFPIDFMVATGRTVFLDFQPPGVVLFIFRRCIGALFAIGALELDDYPVFAFFSHRTPALLFFNCGQRGPEGKTPQVPRFSNGKR
jgi:hypothetical protein